MINCKLCNEVICKYKMDLGNTVWLNRNSEDIYICDNCAKEIMESLLERI